METERWVSNGITFGTSPWPHFDAYVISCQDQSHGQALFQRAKMLRMGLEDSPNDAHPALAGSSSNIGHLIVTRGENL